MHWPSGSTAFSRASMAWAGSSKPRRRRFWQWIRRSICTTPAGPTPRWATARRKRSTAWRRESEDGRTGKRVRTGLEGHRGCAASRLRSGSRTRLRSAAKRRNQPQISHIRKTPDDLTNLNQDLTFIELVVQVVKERGGKAKQAESKSARCAGRREDRRAAGWATKPRAPGQSLC